MPLTAPEDDRTYDTNYFLRDTRRSPRDVFVAKHEDVTMIESDEAKLLSASPTSSKGQQVCELGARTAPVAAPAEPRRPRARRTRMCCGTTPLACAPR